MQSNTRAAYQEAKLNFFFSLSRRIQRVSSHQYSRRQRQRSKNCFRICLGLETEEEKKEGSQETLEEATCESRGIGASKKFKPSASQRARIQPQKKGERHQDMSSRNQSVGPRDSAGSQSSSPPRTNGKSTPSSKDDSVELKNIRAEDELKTPVPIEEDIMQLARLGEIGAIQKLFESGKYHARYADEEGITPLHVRLHPRHISVILT